MRVLFLHTAHSGLTAEYKVHAILAKYARSDEFDPYFIWQGPIDPDLIGEERIIVHDFGRDMSITPKPTRFRRAALMTQKLPKSLSLLFSKVEQLRPDVIYTSQQNLDVRFASLVAKRFDIPHVIHIHYNVGPWLGKSTLNTIRKSTRLIAVSEYTRQTALLQGVSPSVIQTVINPSPVALSKGSYERCSVRAEFGFADSVPLAIAVGRLDPGKGHLDLIEAFSQVIPKMPEARLLICGKSSTRDHFEDHLRRRADELKVAPSIFFAGQRNDIPAIMRSANVFCLPTELDPCPLVFLEAMAEGLPIVAYYSGGIPELVLHLQTGLLSYPGDTGTLAANMLKVLSDRSYARQLGEAGKKREQTEFAPECIAERWLNVMERMIN